MREKLTRFMMGRYGMDKLGQFSLGVAVAFMIISLFFRTGPWYLLAFLVLILAYYRMFSKQVQKRYAENEKFLKQYNKVKNWIHRQKSYMIQRKTHHIYSCPSCRQKIRIPKGKGKVSIHCQKCGTDFIKKS